MSTPIPKNVEEFKIALGEAILELIVQEFKNMDMKVPESDVTNVPAFARIALADKWCEKNREELWGLAQVALLAGSQTDAYGSLILYVRENVFGVKDFLNKARPGYVTDVFKVGTLQVGQELQDFLRLLQRIVE